MFWMSCSTLGLIYQELLNSSFMSIVIQLKILITGLNYTATQKGFKYPSLTLINALPDYV